MVLYQMPKIRKNETENTVHPVGQNFLVDCVGYRGLAHRNRFGQWKSIFGDKTLPKNLTFIPPIQTNLQVLPDDQSIPVIVPAADPVLDGSDRN